MHSHLSVILFFKNKNPIPTLNPKPAGQSRPFFVTTYNTHAEQIQWIVNNNWAIIESNTVLSQVFPESPIDYFRRTPMLIDKLMHSYLPADKKGSWLTIPLNVCIALTEIMCKLNIC